MRMFSKFAFIYYLLTISGFCFLSQNTEEEVTLEFKNESLRYVLETFSKQTGAEFIYQDELISDVNISCGIKGKLSAESLKTIMDKADLDFRQFGNNSYVLLGKRKPKVKKVRTIVLEAKSTDSDTLYTVFKPKLIKKYELTYPAEAIKNNISGNVRLRLLINTSGEVIKSLLESSSGSNLLDTVSLDFSRKLKFTPALANGEPFNVWLSMKFEFNLIDVQE